jgi:hypothetical protein
VSFCAAASKGDKKNSTAKCTLFNSEVEKRFFMYSFMISGFVSINKFKTMKCPPDGNKRGNAGTIYL